jgi:hypothetical protein
MHGQAAAPRNSKVTASGEKSPRERRRDPQPAKAETGAEDVVAARPCLVLKSDIERHPVGIEFDVNQHRAFAIFDRAGRGFQIV